MTIRTMRRVDRWLGVPLCAALTVHRWLIGRWRRRPERIRRIVLVKLAEQGSTVLACAAIRRAIERVGLENVFFLVFAENRFILDAMDLIPARQVVAIPTTGAGALIRGLASAVRRLRRERIDAAVDFEFFARSSAALAYLSGASRRVGFHARDGGGPFRGDLMTHRLSYNPHLHTSEVFFSQVEALTVPPDRLPALDVALPGADRAATQVRFPPEQVEEVRALLRRSSGRPDVQPLVLLNPNCSDLLPLRMWPTDRYVELARLLLARYPDVHVGLTGAPEEEAAAARLAAQIADPRCFPLAGRTTLPQLLVLYGLARVLVTNDSGPAHFAALTPVEVVVLFGPETPRLFAARTPRHHILWAGLPCSPCVNAYNNRNSSCRNNLCMQRISVEQVFEQVCAILDGRPAGCADAPDARGVHRDAEAQG